MCVVDGSCLAADETGTEGGQINEARGIQRASLDIDEQTDRHAM